MYKCLIFASIIMVAYAGAPVDTNCTDGTNYLASAANCQNVYADAACEAIYTGKIEVGKGDERPKACFSSDGTTLDVEIRDIAIANCPKTCGYCCITKEWSCENAPIPRLACKTITKAMCNDPTWREIIAQDCPASCGFCMDGGCIDAAPDCHLNPSVCFMHGLEDFSRTNCKRTCGLCEKINSGNGTCHDSSPSCVSWKKNGYCTSVFYPEHQKKQTCGRTCGLCNN